MVESIDLTGWHGFMSTAYAQNMSTILTQTALGQIIGSAIYAQLHNQKTPIINLGQ